MATSWSEDTSLQGIPGLGFSFASDTDGWAYAGSGRAADNMYPLYRYDNGAWSMHTIEIDGQNNWTPAGVIATGPGRYAVLGVIPDGDAYSVVYRTGTVGGDLSDDKTPATNEGLPTAPYLMSVLADGTILMGTGRGGNQEPSRVLAANISQLD